jgi:hypothetical protein
MLINKNTLNIASFLSNYKVSSKPFKLNKKRRRSHRSTTAGAYIPTTKFKIRSQSSTHAHNIRSSIKNTNIPENLVNITIPARTK